MQPERFAPPEAPIEPPAPPPQKRGIGGVRPLAVLAGFVADMGISFVIGFAISAVLVAWLLAQSVPAEDLIRGIVQLASSTPVTWAAGLLGLAATSIGAFIAARMSPGYEMRNAVGVGVLSAGFGLLIPGSYVALNVLTFAASPLGGWLARRRPA